MSKSKAVRKNRYRRFIDHSPLCFEDKFPKAVMDCAIGMLSSLFAESENITRPKGEYHFFAAKIAAEKYHISSPTKYITAMPETVKLPALPLTHPRLLFRRSGCTEYTVSMRLCAIGA
ncbi:MAG: hypothetical protein E7604_08925 [Ruminococcaceae bacterium]|nr:hypothetical protein [Oscillospiraceae bacterium]